MSAEPEKFFVGVVDLFAVLLPGAVSVYLVKDTLGPQLIKAYSTLPNSEAWAVFAVASYLLGHFIFLIGAWILDDVYDSVRRGTRLTQVRQLACGGLPSGRLTQWLARWLFPKEEDRALRTIIRLKAAELGAAADVVNAFQWCKARLLLNHSDAFAVVQRFEADSKFFRSLQVVLVAVFVVALASARWAAAGGSVLLFVLAFWRYAEQRLKATNHAYWLVIEDAIARNHHPSVVPTIDWTHAGGVVVRGGESSARYLLVRPSDGGDEWVLPKGHIEVSEMPAETAVREVEEECGVWARVRAPLEGVSFVAEGAQVQAMFFLMEYVSPSRRRRVRKQQWLEFDRAITSATHPETRTLIQAAQRSLHDHRPKSKGEVFS